MMKPAAKFPLCVALSCAFGLLAPCALRAAVLVEKTIVSDMTVPDNGTAWSDFFWEDSGLSSISGASATLVLSSPFSGNPMKLGDLSGMLYFGLPAESYRQSALASFSSATQTFDFGSAFNGAWLASGLWELELTDSRGGGIARLDRWVLSLTGEAATSGSVDPGAGGAISVVGTGTQTFGGVVNSSGTNNDAVYLGADSGAEMILSNGIGGTGDFRKEGEGALRIEGTSSNFSGKLVVHAGEVQLASSTALGPTGSLEITGSNALVRLANSASISNSIVVSNGSLARLDGAGTLAGSISGTGTLLKEGSGTVTVTASNTFTGTTEVTAGRLTVANGGVLNSSNATVTNQGRMVINGSLAGSVTAVGGGTIAGSGTVGSLAVQDGGILSPGNSAGTTTATNGATWSEGGIYDWEIFDLDGPAGTGWDLLDVTGGVLDLTGITTSGGYTINLITLQSDNSTPGSLVDFDPDADYSDWLIARAPTVTGFSANLFTLNSASFVGATGTFGITLLDIAGDDGIFLTYTAPVAGVPEPGTWAAAVLLLAVAVCWNRKRRAARA